MIAVFDLGIGNLRSVRSGFQRAGSDTVVVANSNEWNDFIMSTPDCLGVVLPGVGSFHDAMEQMQIRGLIGTVEQVVAKKLPLFGICLGMQLLFSSSEEHGTSVGLGLIAGHIKRIPNDAKVPHMGWNSFRTVHEHPLLLGVNREDYVYFVHSYYANDVFADDVIATVDYANCVVPAVVARREVYGAQFHPEKSGPVGEQILKNFVQLCEIKACEVTL